MTFDPSHSRRASLDFLTPRPFSHPAKLVEQVSIGAVEQVKNKKARQWRRLSFTDIPLTCGLLFPCPCPGRYALVAFEFSKLFCHS